jgi:MFS family permease
VPVSERSRSLSLVYSGMFIGSIMGLALSPAMIAAMGWPSVFYIFGSLGVGWYTVWSRRAASTPADDPHISKAEKVGRVGSRGQAWGGVVMFCTCVCVWGGSGSANSAAWGCCGTREGGGRWWVGG